MNIQIFGSKKNNDSKKAERYFKERGIRYQYIDIREKGLSKGEFTSVASALGGVSELIDPCAKDKDTLLLIKYMAPEDAAEKIFENQQVLRLPIVRNGREATIGYCPDEWKAWE